MKNSFKYIVSTAFAMALVLFAACGKESVANPTSGRVRFYNAVSDAPAAGMDLVIDGRRSRMVQPAISGNPTSSVMASGVNSPKELPAITFLSEGKGPPIRLPSEFTITAI